MEIASCPVLHPTAEEFADFYSYIHFLDRTYKLKSGMVKIVPPAAWKPQAKDYQQKLEHLSVKHPIEQNVQGKGGFYESKNIVQTKMTLKAYRKYAERESKKVSDVSIAQKEKLFWKTITYSPPIYGADLTGTLMDEAAGEWNLNSLHSLLRYALTEKVKGVTEPYCYIGSWKAFFSWHKQDLDLSALNYIHEGASKYWYSISRDHSYILEQEARDHFKEQVQKCSEFLRHKTFLINPEVLLQRHPELKISKVEHKAGEIMMVFGGAYHTGFNTGFNIAEAVNYGTIDWLGELLAVKVCKCFRKNVQGEIESILYNLENSSLYEELSKMETFKVLQYHVLMQQYNEGLLPMQVEPEGPAVVVQPVEPEKIEKTGKIIEVASKKTDKKEKHEEWVPGKKSSSSKASGSIKIKKQKDPQTMTSRPRPATQKQNSHQKQNIHQQVVLSQL